jgi:hypothetical protein
LAELQFCGRQAIDAPLCLDWIGRMVSPESYASQTVDFFTLAASEFSLRPVVEVCRMVAT